MAANAEDRVTVSISSPASICQRSPRRTEERIEVQGTFLSLGGKLPLKEDEPLVAKGMG